jgi:RNA polymerase sigma factor (TIGR02999 family)
MSQVTRILDQIQQGDAHAAKQLLPLVYEELRKLAAQRLAEEQPGRTLQATALVHEAYLRLVGDQRFDSRSHFFAAAAEAMRRILIDEARRRRAVRRGGHKDRVALPESRLVAPMPDDQLMALDEALEQLATIDPTAAKLVQLRFFAGLGAAEAAQALGMSVRSAHDLWAYARSWLRRKIKGD